jgi:hypothetical protein
MGVETEVVAQPAPPAEPEPALEEVDLADVLPELDAIFSQATQNSARQQDVDSFWDALTNTGSSEVSRADAISYDQARKLGLAPEE